MRRATKRDAAHDAARDVLLRGLVCGFGGRAWYGGTLLGALRACPSEARLWAPPGRRCIWEQLLHVAYWKHRALLKLGVRRRFERPGSNWPRLPASASDAAWKSDLLLLQSLQDQLVTTVRRLPALTESDMFLVIGAGQHDVYHNGQVRWVLREWKRRPARKPH